MDRAVVRCEVCKLNQFETTDGQCRRCRRALPIKVSLLTEPPPRPPKPDPHIFGVAFAFYRQALGIPRTEIRRYAGVGLSTMSKLEKGRIGPSIRMAERIAGALDIPIRWLFEAPTPERRNLVFAWRVLEVTRASGVKTEAALRSVYAFAKMRGVVHGNGAVVV